MRDRGDRDRVQRRREGRIAGRAGARLDRDLAAGRDHDRRGHRPVPRHGLVRRLAPGARDVAVAEPAAAAPVHIPIASAEALAAEGRWAEAIHALLLETLEALSRAARLAPSLTSREIVARVPLPVRAREALSGLVLAVEVSRFGGADAAEGDYRACLDRFHAFLETYRGGPPQVPAGGPA